MLNFLNCVRISFSTKLHNVEIIVSVSIHMQRIPVTSSDISSIGYENDVLEIEFHSGKSVYQYFQVPEHEYQGLMNAQSHGKYFNQNIKNKYITKKIS